MLATLPTGATNAALGIPQRMAFEMDDSCGPPGLCASHLGNSGRALLQAPALKCLSVNTFFPNNCLPQPVHTFLDTHPAGRQIGRKFFVKKNRMTQPLTTTKGRIAQSLYVLGGLFSLASLVTLVIFLVAIVDAMQNHRRYFSSEIEGAMLSTFYACFSYGIGWGLRWIISGTTTSVIDYVRDPARIAANPFVMVPVAVLSLFAIALPLLGITNTTGTFETQFAEGLGAGIAVLLLSCLGLLYKADRGSGFLFAALGFSFLFVVSRIYSPL